MPRPRCYNLVITQITVNHYTYYTQTHSSHTTLCCVCCVTCAPEEMRTRLGLTTSCFLIKRFVLKMQSSQENPRTFSDKLLYFCSASRISCTEILLMSVRKKFCICCTRDTFSAVSYSM